MILMQEGQIYSFISLPIKHNLHFKVLVLLKTHLAILWLFQNRSIEDVIYAARKKIFHIHPWTCKAMRIIFINFPSISQNTFLLFLKFYCNCILHSCSKEPCAKQRIHQCHAWTFPGTRKIKCIFLSVITSCPTTLHMHGILRNVYVYIINWN